MYVRMILLMLIYFYTSRILLKQLGVSDFGIYSLVGSLVAMFESVKILFTSSTQRFFNFVMGRKDELKLNTVFNISLYINLLIAVFFLVCVELVGLWFISCKANIPESRIFASHVVFQLSLFATILSIVTTPYDALIIAHEKMDVYAVISLIDGVLKLIIVFLLIFSNGDKLIFYGSLVFVVTIIIRLITLVYCHRNYRECKFKRARDKALFKEMFVFAGWQFLGNSSATLVQNGLNLLLNAFGGTLLNAARGVAYQVKNAVNLFLNNITIVVNPYVTKLCAGGERGKMFDMLYLSSKIVFVLDVLVAVPLMFLTPQIVSLWLGEVPQYSVVFIRILVLNTLVSVLRQQLDILFKAVGRLKHYQIFDSIMTFLPLILSYFLLKFSSIQYYQVFLFVLLADMLGLAGFVFLARKHAGLNVGSYLHKVLMPCSLCFLFVCLCFFVNERFFAADFLLSCLFSFFCLALCLSFMVFVGLSSVERNQIKQVFLAFVSPKR